MGINYDFECIKSFMETDSFRNFSATYGLDSQVIANCYKAFASYIDVPKESCNTYHLPYKDNINSANVKNIEVHTVDRILPEPHIEKPPFPVKIKEHSILASVVNKSAKKALEPAEQIAVEPTIAIVKDLVTENVEGGHIVFCEDASNIVSHPSRTKKAQEQLLS